MVPGVTIKVLKKFVNQKGFVQKMIQLKDKEFTKFGEIYFSALYPGVVKGWHIHKKSTLNYALVTGKVKLVLFSKGKFAEYIIDEKKPFLVNIPPNIWVGLKNLGKSTAIIANLTDFPYDPDEIKRIDPKKNRLIKYDWDK